MRKSLKLGISLLIFSWTLLAETLPQKTMTVESDLNLTRLYDMNSIYQNDVEDFDDTIYNSGSRWVKEGALLIGMAPTEEYNEKKTARRRALGLNAHVKRTPFLRFPSPK